MTTNHDLWAEQHPQFFKRKAQPNLSAPTPRKRKAAKVLPIMPEAIRNGDTITMTLPLPPSELQPNRKTNLHHYKRARLTKATRDAAAFMVRWVALASQWEAMRLDVEIWTARRMDDDGITGWLKSTRDGIADGLRCNDANMQWGRVVQHNDAKRDGLRQVVITITKIE